MIISKRIKNVIFGFCLLCGFLQSNHAIAQTKYLTISDKNVKAVIAGNGIIQKLEFNVKGQWQQIDFRSDSLSGPLFHLNRQPVQLKQDDSGSSFSTLNNGIYYKLSYEADNGNLVINAEMENRSLTVFSPTSAGLIMGLDALMETYPQWNSKHFPTLLRAEKTHFWGYAMSPLGSIVGIASPDSVASWSINYFKDHYVKTFNVDLLNKNPLPQRHPNTLTGLKPGEKRRWKLYLCHVESLDKLKPMLSALCRAPMIDAKGAYTFAKSEKKEIDIFSETPFKVSFITPGGKIKALQPVRVASNKWKLMLAPDEDFGHYKLQVKTPAGKQSEALFYLRKPWSYYLEKARDQTLLMPPRAAIYAESYYSGFSNYLGKKYVPNPQVDPALDSAFRAVFPKMFNYDNGELYVIPNVRVQSLYTAIGILTDAYQAYHRISDLDLAARLADHLIDKYQKADGSYRNIYGVYYTSVIYGTKPMFELAAIEKVLGEKDSLWRKRAENHYASAKLAVQDLCRRLDDIETEGEQTFEDGMISCSALQLGFYALQTKDENERKTYTEALRYMLNKHRCLEQTEVPDARMNGGTLRFWEAWYDIRFKPHVLNSPHGWSSWKTYATYYMYLLTGEENWLKETMDAVGSAMQVIDVKRDGYLSWGFIQDPYVEATYAVEDSLQKGKTVFKSSIIGEEYRPLIMRWKKDHGGDNTVHEHFKMLAEVALTNAFVVEHANGTFTTYNCSLKNNNGILQITPYEKLVTNIHFNLIKPHTIRVKYNKNEIRKNLAPGMSWIHEKGVAE